MTQICGIRHAFKNKPVNTNSLYNSTVKDLLHCYYLMVNGQLHWLHHMLQISRHLASRLLAAVMIYIM